MVPTTAMQTVLAFFKLYEEHGCADYENEALDILQRRLNKALGPSMDRPGYMIQIECLTANSHGRMIILYILFNIENDTHGLIDKLAKAYDVHPWRRVDSQKISKLQKLNTSAPFSATEISIIEKENARMRNGTSSGFLGVSGF